MEPAFMAGCSPVCGCHCGHRLLGGGLSQSFRPLDQSRCRFGRRGARASASFARFLLVNIWKAILAAVVIFGAGVIAGCLATKLHSTPTPPAPGISPLNGSPRRLLDRMQRELNLSAPQRERIEKYLAESRERMKPIWER